MATAEVRILAHLASWVVMVVGVKSQEAPCVLGAVAGRSRVFCFGRHEEAVVVDRRELELVVLLGRGRWRMVVELHGESHGLRARNRRWLP